MSVQNDYRRESNPFIAGQIANTFGAKCESGTFKTGTIDSVDRPDTLPFGYGCGYVGDAQVARYIKREAVGTIAASPTPSSTQFAVTPLPGSTALTVGDIIYIGSDDGRVTGVNASGTYTVGGISTAPSAGAAVARAGGRTNFAGVAVANSTLFVNNSPTDTYNEGDSVSIGSKGDFVVVCDKAVARGDKVSINTGTSAANYGKFSNTADGSGYIGIPGAVFMSASSSVTPYDGGTAVLMAVVRLGTQPR